LLLNYTQKIAFKYLPATTVVRFIKTKPAPFDIYVPGFRICIIYPIIG